MSLFPALLVVHIMLAVALLLPSVVLPFVLRDSAAPLARGLLQLQGAGALIGLGVAITGLALLLLIGGALLERPWLVVALALYALNLGVAAFIAQPNLRRMLAFSRGGDDDAWRRRARRQRLVAYGMAALIGAIGLLMSTKPALW